MILIVLALVTASAATAFAEDEPGLRHRYFMKGQLLDVEGTSVYLCVGSHDGARAGQQVDVFRYSRVKDVNPKAAPRFERKEVGRLEIAEVVDEHFARGKVLSGEVRVGDMAELEMKDE